VIPKSNPSKRFIAKRISKDSDEPTILKFIGLSRPQPENIISLIDSFHDQSGSWIILPELSDIRYTLKVDSNRLRNHIAQVCWGLIEGLAYLHKIYIAHRDINPNNLVVDRHCCLKIIDFDIAIRLNDENEEVSGYCGTKGWVAPEIEKKMGKYSPIRADRWSCGNIILQLFHALKKNNGLLEGKAKELKADNPRLRPSLLEWENWTETSLSSDELGESGTTTAKTQRRSSEADEDYAELPKIKKPRHDVDSMNG
jgi:serine/threonine protein kinase